MDENYVLTMLEVEKDYLENYALSEELGKEGRDKKLADVIRANSILRANVPERLREIQKIPMNYSSICPHMALMTEIDKLLAELEGK